MRRIAVLSLVALAATLSVTACEQVKSATPLSPSLAGPIAGVEISAPVLVSPAAGAKISTDSQPITLVVQNAGSSGVRPLNYLFEIATDINFTSKVFSQTNVAPGEGGRTSLRMTQSLQAERTYYWRVKAQDGANSGDYSAATPFDVFTPVVIGTPTPNSPADGSTVTTRQPVLEVINAPVSGPAGTIKYLFEVATDAGMSGRVVLEEVFADSRGRTSLTVPHELATSTSHFWRARAFDASRVGEWSRIVSFITPAPVVVTPPPTPPTPPPRGGGGGTPTPAANDEINVNAITVVFGVDIRSWAVTSTVTSATHNGDDLCIRHTKQGQWPRLPWFGDNSVIVEGNQWFFANIGGRWLAGANEWLRPGQDCKVVDGHVGHGGFGGSALAEWTPAPGEIVGVAVSTPARAGQWGTAERSNIVLLRW